VAYPTTEELVAASSVDELAALTVEQQDALRDSAIIAVEEFCGQVFEAFDGTITVDGRRSRVLYLPRRLEEMEAITVAGSALATTDVLLTPDGDKLVMNTSPGNYYERTLRELSGESLYGFDADVQGIAITGTWGWDEPPAGVVEAIRVDMEETAVADSNALSPTIAAYRKLGLRSISQGNLRAEIGEEGSVSPRVARLLTPHVWSSGVGQLV
jgi:hypothetical protein